MSDHYSDPDCPKCKGRGFLYGASLLTLPGEAGGRFCDCTIDALRLENMERIWKSLSESKMPEELRVSPPLRKLVKRNLWITASEGRFRAHLKAVAFNEDTMWDCRVFSDKDLLSSWLKTARAQGHKIYDTEIDEDVGFAAMDIDELVEPPGLVILLLGVKQAPNREAPNVLLEALTSRKHIGKPTWIVDQPDHPIDRISHRCYSDTLDGWLSHWPHVQLTKAGISLISEATVNPVSTSKLSDAAEVPTEVDAAIDQALEDLDSQEEEEEEYVEEEEGDHEPTAFLQGMDASPTDDRKKKYGKKKPWGGKR